MKRSVYRMGALYGTLTSLIVMAFAYLGNSIFALPFFPFNLFDWLTRHLPGVVIHTAIQLMVTCHHRTGPGTYRYGCQVGRTNPGIDPGIDHRDWLRPGPGSR